MRIGSNELGLKSETEILALCVWLGLADTSDIGEWLDAYVANVPQPHPDALELFTLDSEQMVSAFLAFALAEFNFDPNRARGSRVATKLLTQLCRSVLDGTLSVPRFCDTVKQLDAKFIDPSLGLPYPSGLHDLWNGCDWCDEQHGADQCRQLGSLCPRAARHDARGTGAFIGNRALDQLVD